MNIDIISVIVFGLLVFIYTFTFSYNFLLVCHLLQSLEKNKVKNLFFSLLGGTLSLFVFCGLAGGIFLNSSKLKKPSPFFQSLFHIPVTGVELLIILDIIAGIVLGLWLFKLCVVLWQHSLKKELVIFLACISLLLFVGMGLTIFFILHPSNQSVVAISGIIIASILEVLLALLLRINSKSKSFQHTYSGFWIIIYFVLIHYGFG